MRPQLPPQEVHGINKEKFNIYGFLVCRLTKIDTFSIRDLGTPAVHCPTDSALKIVGLHFVISGVVNHSG